MALLVIVTCCMSPAKPHGDVFTLQYWNITIRKSYKEKIYALYLFIIK